ncbi:DUF2784 domain-containing protein [Agilicoccus flavus]|uniref:DUF2784 domain-containing protein n=1 Tax=Agilicoccus flavus TaxID=2775968 RepID=UPI001CF6F319|nr:DUF2784 domain-containing protein [Agilicoccus flavus]
MIWVLLVIANVAMLAHFAFLVFLIGGGFVAWRHPWVAWPHLATAVWAFGIEAWHWVCPLTLLENWARHGAGMRGLAPTGFIDTYIQGVMYPAELNTQVLGVVATVVLASWLGAAVAAWRRRRRRSPPGPGEPTPQAGSGASPSGGAAVVSASSCAARVAASQRS